MPAIPIDEADLRERTIAQLTAVFPGCDVDVISPLQGGSSSVTYWTTFTPKEAPPQRVVLKVAPAGLEPVKNRDVLRQARVLQALSATEVPVPRVLAEDAGTPPEIPPFFIMSFEEGQCVEPNSLPDDAAVPAAEVRDRELQAAGILGRLHRIDPVTVGLGDEPETSLEAEVERWRNSLASCDEDLRAGAEDVGEALSAQLPGAGPTTLMHGDFRLGNTLSHGHQVESVIDWEIWQRGDAACGSGLVPDDGEPRSGPGPAYRGRDARHGRVAGRLPDGQRRLRRRAGLVRGAGAVQAGGGGRAHYP